MYIGIANYCNTEHNILVVHSLVYNYYTVNNLTVLCYSSGSHSIGQH